MVSTEVSGLLNTFQDWIFKMLPVAEYPFPISSVTQKFYLSFTNHCILLESDVMLMFSAFSQVSTLPWNICAPLVINLALGTPLEVHFATLDSKQTHLVH